jgi:class 3 adenylate cyclase
MRINVFKNSDLEKKHIVIKNKRKGQAHSAIVSQIYLEHHAPENWQKIIAAGTLERLLKTGEEVSVHVLVGDIRQSTFLMKESISLPRFAQITRDLMKAIKSTASSNEGWFDKFTGDGFIIYWLCRAADKPDKYIERILAFCLALLSYFPEVMNEYRLNSRNFPAGVGLSLGVDSGPCSLVEIGGGLDIIGPPVVGASRMVCAAQPFETLFNVSIGMKLYENRREMVAKHGIHVSKKKISTKEYGGEKGVSKDKSISGGQEAYSVRFRK